MNVLEQRVAADLVGSARGVPVAVPYQPSTGGRFRIVEKYSGTYAGRPLPKPLAQYMLLGRSEFHSLPPVSWAVKGLFPRQGLGLLYGASGAGKSFLALDMAIAIAEGQSWFGHRTTRSPVIYVCLEGAAGFVKRMEAWEAAEKRATPDLLKLINEPFNLRDSEDVQKLLRAIAGWKKSLSPTLGPPVVVIDTLNRAMPGADENGSSDMSTVLEACALITKISLGLNLLVHHVGKDADRGPRGHSSLFSAADAAILVCRSGKGRFWEAKKVKDGQDGMRGDFELETVVLGVDDDGDEVSSCVVRGGCSHSGGVASELSPSLKTALVSLVDVLGEPTMSVIQVENPIVPLADWRAVLYKNCSAASASGKRNALNRALSELQDLGYLAVTGDGLGLQVSGADLARILPELRTV